MKSYLQQIQEVLYPPDDPDAAFSEEMAEDIAGIINQIEPDLWVPVSEGFPKESGLFAVQARIPKTNSRNVTLVRWDASKTRDQQIATTWRRAICWFSFCIPSPH